MSFEDTVDNWRDLRAIEALERKQRLAIRQPEIAAIQRLGYLVNTYNGGLHVKIRWLEYWPSTKRWNNPIRRKKGYLEDGESLLALVQREVGEPGPALAKRAALAVKG